MRGDLPDRMPRGHAELKAAAEILGRPARELLAMSYNADPFNTGRPADVRDAQWFADIWRRFGYTSGVHLRRIHYRIVTSGEEITGPAGALYENTAVCWGSLKTASSKARDLGLVDPMAFVDRRNDPPIINSRPRGGEPNPPDWDYLEPEPWTVPTVPAWYPQVFNWGVQVPDYEVGSAHLNGDPYGHHPGDAPYLVEVWIEKTTMDDILVPLCSDLDVNLVRVTGSSSETQIHLLLRRVAEHGKPARVFYIADHDPRGETMAPAVARNIEYYADAGHDIALTRLALTPAQAAAYELPRAPIKDTDGGKANFEKVHGAGAVELDALEATRPGELARIVTEAVEPYLDGTLPARLQAAEARAEAALDEAFSQGSERVTSGLAQARERVQEINERHKPAFQALAREVAEVLAPYRERHQRLAELVADDLRPVQQQLDQLREQLAEIVAETEPEMPARPQPEAPGGEESGWLYRSDRHWLDQLDRYRAERNGGVPS